MKTKYVIIILLLSLLLGILAFFGQLNKLISTSDLLLISHGLWILGIVLGLFKLLTHKRLKEIMNE